MTNHPSVLFELSEAISFIHSRGWCPGTGGNFSVVSSLSPLRLSITPSSVDKESVLPEQFIEVDETGRLLSGSGKPSAETLLHVAIIESRRAGCVLHTHSPWNTALSLACPEDRRSLKIYGLEMLKGLSGVATHQHSETVPILGNSQDMTALSSEVLSVLSEQPECHGFLLRGHGLYTWGADVFEARRHVEIFEFLFETVGRLKSIGAADGFFTYS
ncbi:MAG: methylthioribulose 1-phosphate dehydratase [Bdellovibrionales bacterium]|nr:methylthioribulose 1-phosphate dehydratase [Bdellovibrionales bacterium]